MPTIVSPFASNEISLKYKEPYISEGLNRDVSIFAPSGVHRGFALTGSATALHVTLKADPMFADHGAVVRTLSGASIGLKRVGGDIDLNLSAFTNKTVVIAVYATYSTATATTGDLRIYQLSPSDEFSTAVERPNLVVLGTVVVPASGVIPAANISNQFRTDAWQGQTQAQRKPDQLLRNGSFEMSELNGGTEFAAWYWAKNPATNTPSYWKFVSGDVASAGELRCAELGYVGATGGVTSALTQTVNVPAQAGQVFRVQLKKRVVATVTGGTLQVKLHFLDTNGTETLTPASYTIPTASVDSQYQQIDTSFVAPSGAMLLSYLEIVATGVTGSADGPLLHVDDVCLWRDSRSAPQVGLVQDEAPSIVASSVALIPDAGRGLATTLATQIARSLVMVMDASGTEAIVSAKRRDGATAAHPILQWLGRISAGSQKVSQLDPTLSFAYTSTGLNYSLIWQSNPSSGLTCCRLYVKPDGTFVFTTNAAAQPGGGLSWGKDTSGATAAKVEFRIAADASSIVGATRHAANNTVWIEGPHGEWDDTYTFDLSAYNLLAHVGNLTSLNDLLAVSHGISLPSTKAYVATTQTRLGPSPTITGATTTFDGKYTAPTDANFAMGVRGNMTFGTPSASANTAYVHVFSLQEAMPLLVGRTLASVHLTIQAAGGHSALPQLMPRIAVVRCEGSGLAAYPGLIESLYTGNWSIDTSVSTGAYATYHSLGLTVDQHGTIDPFLYTYALLFQEEGGANSLPGIGIGNIQLFW